MIRKMKKQEEETARCLGEVLRHMPGGKNEAGFSMDDLSLNASTLSDSLSEGSEDSPTKSLCRGLSARATHAWKTQRQLTKVVMKVLSMDSDTRPCACCTGVGTAKPMVALPGHWCDEVPPTSSVASSAPPLPLCVEKHEATMPVMQLLPPRGLMHLLSNKKPLSPIWPDAHSPTATPQPEEEADGPLPRKSGGEMALPRKSKLLAAEEALAERWVVEGSRNSTISDAEPAREPQPLGQSPRDCRDMEDPITELSGSTDTPMLESPGGAASSSCARPSASGPEHEDNIVTEADSTMNSSGIGELDAEGETEADAEVEAEASANIDEACVDYTAIMAGMDGMHRMETMLHAIEQAELKRDLHIIVPDGIGPDRKVTFNFENKTHDVAVPEGYEVGQQVLVTLSNRPFLERTAAQARTRGHQPTELDRWSIIDILRHSLRTDKESSTLAAEEFKSRYCLYGLLRGRSAAPLLPFTTEETPADLLA